MKHVTRFVSVAVLIVMLGVSVAAEQGGPPPQLPGFVLMNDLTPREVLPATPLVFYAYSFVWLALVGYLWTIWRRTGRLEQDLAEVRRRLSAGTGQKGH